MGRQGAAEEVEAAGLVTGHFLDVTRTAMIKEKRNSITTAEEQNPWSTRQVVEGVVGMDRYEAEEGANGLVEAGEEAAGATRRDQIEIRSNGDNGSPLITKPTNAAWKRVKVEKGNGGMTAGRKTCVVKTQTAEIVRTCHFAKDADSTTTGGNGVTRAKKTDSMLPGIGVTTDGVAHP